MDDTTRWVAGIAITILLALVGVVWTLVRTRQDQAEQRQDRADNRLAEHVKEDIRVHERVVKIETEVTTLKEEVRAIRDMRHEIIERVTKTLAEWYTSIIDRMKK